jgi:hypothetical protein
MFDFFTHRQGSSAPTLFYVPTQDPFENPLVETNPAALRQWATALPFANPDQLSEAVLTSLVRLNRYPGLLRKRDELMEIYHTPVVRLLHSSSGRRGPAPTPTLRRVMLEMAYGYSHIANECLRSKANKKNLGRLTFAIYHAIRFYLQEYLYACEEFDCRDIHTYREISRLRTFAEEQQINHTPVDEGDNKPFKRTIEQQYNRFLLLRLLDPCHLQEGEPRLCFDYLDELAVHARFKPPSREVDRSGHYVVDRLGEVPPSLFEPEGLDTLAQPRFTLFDLNPVSQQIHQQLRNLERSGDQNPPVLSKLTTREITNLLARILKSWHIRPQRDSERHTTSGQVNVWTGLQHIYSYLTLDQTVTTEQKDTQDDEITLTQVQSSVHHQAQDPRKPQLTARRSNQSRSGVALHLNMNLAAPSLIGEVVLIRLQTEVDNNDWKIGIVKRALNQQGNILEIGVQFVQGRIVPVSLQSTYRTTTTDSDEVEERPTYPGLYIDQGHTHRSSLIVPKHFFALGQEYRVEEMIPAPAVTPLQLLENTAHFERYRVKPI